MKFCLTPGQWRAHCSRTVAKAHTVPQSSLKEIAEGGHVRWFVPSIKGLKEHGTAFRPVRRGVGVASTFTGFCARHDDQIFSPLEKFPLEGSPEQCFLVGYRALARELHIKSAVVRHFAGLEDLSDGLGSVGSALQSEQKWVRIGLTVWCS